MRLDYMDYQIEQYEDTHTASVYRNGQEVMHLQLSGIMSEEELVDSVAEVMRITGMNNHNDRYDGIEQCLYDGDEPC